MTGRRARGAYGPRPGSRAGVEIFMPVYEPHYRPMPPTGELPRDARFEDDPAAVIDRGSPGRTILAGTGRAVRR